MTVVRDRADDAGAKLPTPVFRPWPPRPATLPAPPRALIQPCFVRPSPPALSGIAGPAAGEPVAAAADHQDHQHCAKWPARPPRFARFVAALELRGGARGSAPADADPWHDARARTAARPPAEMPPAGGRRLMQGDLASLAAIERGLRRLAVRRAALLIGAAGAAALVLIALFEPTGGRDRARLVEPPAEAGALVRAPPTPDRYRPAADRGTPGMPGPLLVANRSPSIDIGHSRPEAPEPADSSAPPGPVAIVDAAIPGTSEPAIDPAPPQAAAAAGAAIPGTTEPPTDPAPPQAVAAVGVAIPETTEPSTDPAPIPASLAHASTAVAAAPPRSKDSTLGPAADGKIAALAVGSGAASEPATEDDDPLYDLAHRLQQKGDVVQAIEAYRMAALANPQHAATYYDWGYLLQQHGDEQGARQKYLLTLHYAPRHPFAHYNLGYIFQKHGDYSRAIQHYQAAIAANPSFFWSWYNLGYIRQQQGQYRAALADYRKSIEVDPKHALSYENIATILRYHRTE